MWKQGDQTHSNWRECMLKALQEGHLTTVITFQATKYLVTLQPYERDRTLGAYKRDVCRMCGELIILELGKQETYRWYHKDAEHGSHAAMPLYHALRDGIWEVQGDIAAPAAETPVACSICHRAIAFNGANWVHVEVTYLDHVATAETS